MSVMKPWQRILRLALLGSATLATSGALAQDFTQPRVIELQAPGAQRDIVVQIDQEPKLWVGVFCRPVDDALRTQLKIPAKQGVVIDGVAPDSPAEKAGLKRHDVLLAVDDKPLADPAELMKFVGEAGEKKLAIKLIRDGKEQTIQVTVEPRPERPEGEAFQLPRQNLDPLRNWIERLNEPAHGAIHLRGFGPAVMFGQREMAKLPDGVSIQINKTGQEPAKVVVTRGEEKWELTDDPEQLAKLPDDLRPAVENMLGMGLAPFQVRIPGPEDGAMRVRPLPRGMTMEKSAPDVEQRLKQVEQQLEKLMNELKSKAEDK
jgi:serine protease Do